MTKKIFFIIVFIFSLALAFAENIESIEEQNTEENVLDNTKSLDNESNYEVQNDEKNIETSEEDFLKDEKFLKTMEIIEEKNIIETPIKKLDDDIFLFMQGFGEAEFKWTIGFEFFKGYTQSFIQSPVLVQEANLSLLLLMKRHWYFGINYKDKLSDSSIYIGYIDIEKDIKKHIRLGNKGINFPNIYPFIRGGSSKLSPGLSAQFEGEKWRFDSIIKYDSGQKNKRIFYGKNEVLENKTSISSWKKAQYFYIPYNDLYGKSFDVYVKDSQYGQWRLLTKDNYTVDSRKNILILNKSYNYGVAINLFSVAEVASIITETKNYFFATSIEDLIDNDVYINIHSSVFLALKKYNIFSCFEISSIYDFENIDYNHEIYVVEKGTSNKSDDFDVKLNYINSYFDSSAKVVLGQVHLSYVDIDYKEAITRFPFLTNNEHIYVPANTNNDKNSYEFLSYVYIPVSDFVLPKDAIDIEVIKNGIPILDFTYDEYTNIVYIKGVLPSDKIEIRWTESKKYSTDGMIVLGLAGQYRPFEWLTLFLASMSNLNVKKDKNEINDKYSISTGFDINYGVIKAGSHFGFEANSNRGDKNIYISKNHFYFNYEDEKKLSIFSNPRVSLDFDVNKSDKLSIHSNAEVGLDIWKIKLGGKISLQDNINNKTIIESIGHRIKVPIYFFYMDEDFFININESILSRTNKIKFEKYINFDHLTFVNYDRRFIYQQVISSISPIIPTTSVGNFFMEFRINLFQKYTGNYNLYNNNYAISWKDSLIDSYSIGVDNPLLRNESISFTFNWSYPKEMNYYSGFSVLGLNFDSRVYAVNNASSDKNENITYSFRLPLAFNEVFITPFWERLASKQISFRRSLNYKDDFISLFASLKEQYWFFATPIIYDIFDQKILYRIQTQKDSYSFSNIYGLDISRLISNTLKDLYIPHEFNTSLTRIIRSNNSNVNAHEYYKLRFNIRYTALDIFMSKYSSGIFKNITQDELVRDYDFYFIFSKDYFNFHFNSIHKLYFYQYGDNKVGFENKFDIEVEKIKTKLIARAWREDISFLYSFRGYRSITNILFSLFTKFNLIDEREEKITVSLFRQTYSNMIDYKFSFRHTQKTKIGENGQIRMFADVSIASTRRSSVLLNLTFGIAGKIEY
ncbi:MAG: hypothetical protein ACTTJ6_01850 [Treponema sp.]